MVNPNETESQDKLTTEQVCSTHGFSLSSLTGLMALAALLIALSAIPFYYALAHQNKDVLAKIELLKQEQKGQLEQNETKTDQIQQEQQTLQNKLDNLNQELQGAMKQRFYQNQDWLLLKTRYYLELAQIHRHWSTHFETVISLLQEADTLLKPLHTPKIFEIRQAIAKEIALLNSIPPVDIAGLLTQLDAAQVLVEDLSFSPLKQEPTEITQRTAPSSPWKASWEKSLHVLKKLLVIRREKEVTNQLMSPLFESLVKENIRLNLQEVQWSILNNNPMLYQLALQQANKNLLRTFPVPSKNTTALLNKLQALQQTKITQEKPKLNLALPLLNQLIEDNRLLLGEPSYQNKQGESLP